MDSSRRSSHLRARAATSLLFVVCWASSAVSQGLGEQFEEAFHDPGPAATTLYLPNEASLQLNVKFSNDTDEKGLWLGWRFHTPFSQVSSREDFAATSYKPTAVCRRAGESDTIYVAGWDERLSAVIVEEWKFTDYQVLGPPVTPETDPDNPTERAGLGGPRIGRTTLFMCTSMAPIAGLACNYYANELWLLEETSPGVTAGYAYDLDSTISNCAGLTLLQPAPLSVPITSAYGPMADKSTLRAFEHPDDGFFIYFERERPWISITDIPAPYELVVFNDDNRDGVMDDVQVQTYTAFFTERPFVEFDERYK